MTISNKIQPTEDLKFLWRQVLKNKKMVASSIHKAPGLYAEISAIIGLLYIMTILAIVGDLYLAINILIKAGVKPAFVFIQVILDFFLAVLPFILITFFSFMDKIGNENWKLYYELDSKLMRKEEAEEQYNARRSENLKHLDEYKKKLFWCKVVLWIINLLILVIAAWKIFAYSSSMPYSIFPTSKGKMVITVAILVAIFHIIATENTLIHLLYWLKVRKVTKEADRTQNLNAVPPFLSTPIPYKGSFQPVKIGYTELVVNEDKTVEIKYAYLIRDEEINELKSKHTGNEDAQNAIIATCRKIVL